MKKLSLVLTLLFAFSAVVYADGEIPMGGKNCTSNCLVSTSNNESENKVTDTGFVSLIFKTVIDIFN